MEAANPLIPDMKFRRLDTRDGLSNSQINDIFQDSKGFIWIATSYGLNRYDGYRFRTFYSDVNDTTTLRNNYVNDIWEDYAGRLWLRQGMNYCVFDPKTETAVRTPSTLLAKMGIKGGLFLSGSLLGLLLRLEPAPLHLNLLACLWIYPAFYAVVPQITAFSE